MSSLNMARQHFLRCEGHLEAFLAGKMANSQARRSSSLDLLVERGVGREPPGHVQGHENLDPEY